MVTRFIQFFFLILRSVNEHFVMFGMVEIRTEYSKNTGYVNNYGTKLGFSNVLNNLAIFNDFR